MPLTVAQRLRRLFESGNRRIDFGNPAVRVGLVLLAAAAVAGLAATAWLAYVDVRSTSVTTAEARHAYVRNVQAKIQEATDTARATLAPRGAAGTVRVRFLVNSNGALLAATLLESSGNRVLDELALRVVRDSAPFERFPDRMRRMTRLVEINSTFSFR